MEETMIVYNNTLLHRVKYLASGKLGGWIESEKNLSQKGNAKVCGNAKVWGNAKVYGDAEVWGNADVFDNAKVLNRAEVWGNAKVYGDAMVSGDAIVYGNAEVYGNADIRGDAIVRGGEWRETPLQIHGSKFVFRVLSKDSITVGCKTKTFAEWLETYEKEFSQHGFTEKQQTEYKRYFNLAAQMYGWDVRLPVEEEKRG